MSADLAIGVLVLVLILLVYWQLRLRRMRSEAIALLQGTAWHIKRVMGFLPMRGAREDRDRREQLAREFIVGSLHSYPDLPKAAFAQHLPDPQTVIDAGFKLMDRNEKKTSEHIYQVAGARQAVQAFLFIMQNRNVNAARSVIIEMMKWQRNEWEGKQRRSVLNFTDLKTLLELPTEEPYGDMPERAAKRPLSYVKKKMILSVADRDAAQIFDGLEFTLDDGSPVKGIAVMKAMQEYAG